MFNAEVRVLNFLIIAAHLKQLFELYRPFCKM